MVLTKNNSVSVDTEEDRKIAEEKMVGDTLLPNSEKLEKVMGKYTKLKNYLKFVPNSLKYASDGPPVRVVLNP